MLQAEEIIAKEEGWISSCVMHHKRDVQVLHKTLPSLHRPQRSLCLTMAQDIVGNNEQIQCR